MVKLIARPQIRVQKRKTTTKAVFALKSPELDRRRRGGNRRLRWFEQLNDPSRISKHGSWRMGMMRIVTYKISFEALPGVNFRGSLSLIAMESSREVHRKEMLAALKAPLPCTTA
ncbi:hypothetical protein AAHA92_15186 [Salvia divinorum]|uniref:Uncharacterized protein n=1 Tax=Salvia divinorum TaxID=28513 RepID=A0ABD1HGJ5_SALDI